MKTVRTTLAAAVLAVVALTVVACAPDPGAPATTTSTTTTSTVPHTPPPYQPIPNPPAIGTLKFFNAAGQQITGGQITDAPFAAYVQSSAPGRTGDTKATLFGYLPRSGVPYNGWTGEQLTLSTAYPNASAPSALSSSALPLVRISAADETLALLQADFPNTAPVGDPYNGLYHFRLKTSGPGQSAGAEFAQADIRIVGTTWSVVYP